MVADSLDHRRRSRIADCKAFARNTVEERFPTGRAVESHVADQNIFFGSKMGSTRWVHDDSAAGKALSNVVVGFAFQRERDTVRQESPQALSRRPRELNSHGVVGQSRGAVAARDFATQQASDGAVYVAHRQVHFDGRKSFESIVNLSEDFVIERLLQTMILRLHAPSRHSRRHRRVIEDCRKVETSRLPVIFPEIDSRFHIQHVDAAHHLVHGAESQLRHVLPKLFRKEEKETDDVLGLSLELSAQHRILRGNAHRASIEMALTHHDAAHRDQRSRGKSELLRPQ